MILKILGSLIVIIATLGLGAIFFAGLIITMNGFSGADAEVGLKVFIGWAIFSAVILGILTPLTMHLAKSKLQFGDGVSFFASVGIFLVAAVIMIFIGMGAALGTAESQRKERKERINKTN